jgi:uncharacterized protein (DUF1697 family)
MAAKKRAPGKVERFALFIRGINVGTNNSLPMAELRKMLTSLGATDVATYVQSGNAVFTSSTSEKELTAEIEKLLSKYMGRPIGTTLRTRDELRTIAASSPFAQMAESPTHHCVTFLSERPSALELAPLEAQDFGEDAFRVEGRQIYSLHPAGQGKSLLSLALQKLKLRGTLTTRNFRTVEKVRELLDLT